MNTNRILVIENHMGMARTKNERKNEHMVREGLRKLGYYEEDTPTHVEEQKSEVVGKNWTGIGLGLNS